MALFYPDILEHNNPNNPLMDDAQLWGSLQIVDDVTARDAIPVAKRRVGMVVVCLINSIPAARKYFGPDTTDPNWTDPGYWSYVNYPFFIYGIVQTLPANTTTTFGVGDKNIYTSFILDYQMVRGAIMAVGSIQILQNVAGIESPTAFTYREFGGALGLVDITTAFNVDEVEVSIEIDNSTVDDVTMTYNLIRKYNTLP